MRIAIFALLLICDVAIGQTNTTSNVSTKGNCSPVVTGNNNEFHFEYCGNDPDQEKKIVEILKAVSESTEKLNAVIEVIKPPKILISKGPQPTPDKSVPPGHPSISFEFYIDRADENAQFGVVCDRACNPLSICTLTGPNSAVLGHLASRPEVAVFLFERQLPALIPCAITVESADDKPIKVLEITHLAITDARMIVLNPKQPPRCVVAGGASMC
jgi:hypothetical protein